MPRPDRALEKSNYSADFLAQLIVSKFKYHLPIYRQQKQLLDSGIFLHRSLLNELLLKSWHQLEPIVKRLREISRERPHRYVDETPICRVKAKESLRYYLWCIHTDLAITFDLTEKRNQKLAKKIFSSFPEESDTAIDFLVRIYQIEQEAKEKEFNPEERLLLRQDKSKEIMESFQQYLKGLNPPPRSSLGKAISYTLKLWPGLTLFLIDGQIEVDNNRVESVFRDVKLGMKNFLFVQSDIGGEALAGFYSLIATCELHNINPFSYLSDLLVKLGNGHPQKRLDELLPWNWRLTENPLAINSNETYFEQNYPVDLMIERLGLKNKVYLDREEPSPFIPMMSIPPP